jgi:hypothetical protein
VPNFEYRYLTEDVPFGLVVTRALAEIVNVRTPAIDEVVRWAQSAMQKLYLVDGKLEGRDAIDLPVPQHHGLSTLTDLIGWYSDESPDESPEDSRSRAYPR